MDLPVYNLEISDNIDDDIEVDFVALVSRPAIQKNFMAFADHQLFAIQNEDQRIISGALMLADTPIYRNQNGQEFYVQFSKESIRKIVLKFFKKGYQQNVNLMHDSNQIVEGVTMFESWISDKNRGIKPMDGFDDAPDGSWFGSFKVENDDVWSKIKSGEFKGFSVEGFFNQSTTPISQEEKLWSNIVEIIEQVFYNPDQERDENGRWTSGGGGGSSKEVNAPSGKVAPGKEVKPGDERVTKLMTGAKESADEVDKIGKSYAEKLGGVVTPINLKSEDSILRKVNDEENGNVGAVKDAVRNTVVIDRSSMASARKMLEEDPRFKPENGGRLKFQDGPQFFGYTGVIANYKTENGTIAEMQINTPAMIFAKEKESNARSVIGSKKYDEIASKTGLKGGLGHAYYEVIRKIDPQTATPSELKTHSEYVNKSIEYYKNFRDL